jgi:hypothetical protein
VWLAVNVKGPSGVLPIDIPAVFENFARSLDRSELRLRLILHKVKG